MSSCAVSGNKYLGIALASLLDHILTSDLEHMHAVLKGG